MQNTKYKEGQRYRVTRDGARFEGLLLFGEQSMSGWSRQILKGETLECLGWKEVHVFGADIAGIMWTGLKVPANAMVMQIWPFESLFRPFPLEGLLELVEDSDDEPIDQETCETHGGGWCETCKPAEPLPTGAGQPTTDYGTPMVKVHKPLPEPTLEQIDDGHIVDLTGHLEPLAIKIAKPEDDEPVDLTNF